MRALRRFCALVLGYDIAVILWGAYVRASAAGAGCGSHWPLCNGDVVPRRPSVATLIEYSHRVSSALVLVLALALVVWAFRAAPAGHPVRRGAVLGLAFTLSEAAVGAGLVLFKLVAHDESLAHAIAITVHLLNTLLLLASLALTYRWAGLASLASADEGEDERPAGLRLATDGFARSGRWLPLAALAGVVLLGATGAIAALGDTLFPSRSLAHGLAQDFSPASHLLLRLRLVHPFLALAVGLLLLYLCQLTLRAPSPPTPPSPSPRPAPVPPAPAARSAPLARNPARLWAHRLRLLVLAQWVAGALDLGLLAPVWLQLLHLLLADLLWIALVLLAAELLVGAAAPVPGELAPPLRAPVGDSG